MKIRRTNMDSSWEIQWGNTAFLIDPWLVGSEVDGFSWLNEQWHTTKCLPISQFNHIDAILISQSYSDHCHIATLKELDKNIPIYASPKAFKRLRKYFPDRRIVALPDLSKQAWYTIGNVQIGILHPGNKLDPIYYGLVLKREGELIVYFAHGFDLSKTHLKLLNKFKIKVLFATFSEIEIPKWMGGKVNPGISNVRDLVKDLMPDYVLNTHDEQKISKGIVMKLAKAKYPDLSSIKFSNGSKFLASPDYAWIDLNQGVNRQESK